MINDCHKCGKPPQVKGMVSCDNDKCPEYKKEFFVYVWQKLKGDLDKLEDAENEFIKDG